MRIGEKGAYPFAGPALFQSERSVYERIRDGFACAMETEAQARTNFFLIPSGLMIGIALTIGQGVIWPIGLTLTIGVLALATSLAIGGGRLPTPFFVLFGCTFAGMSVAAIELARTDTVIFSGEATVRIAGMVLWRDFDDRGRYRYLVEIRSTERPTLSRPPQRVQILVSAKHKPLPVGANYRGLVRLRPPAGPALPGGYDFAYGAYFARLGAYGYALGPPEQPPSDARIEGGFANGLVTLRLKISDRIRETIGGGPGAVAAALVTGERSGVPDDIDQWLRATGLSHVLSISGLHMALVAGFAMALVRGALSAVPVVALTLPTKKIAAMAALAVSTFYLVLSGDDVATERSFVMLAIMLLSIAFDRPSLTLRNVGMAAVVVLAIRPHALMTASFQMSFAATVALVGIYGGYSRWKNQRNRNARFRHGRIRAVFIFAAGLAATSLIAGAATAPYAAYHFQRIAPFGLFANMLAVPIFSFWIMPLSLIAMIVMPLGFDGPILKAIGYGLDLVFEISRQLYLIVPDRPTGLIAITGLALMTFALLAASLLSSRLKWLAAPLAILGLFLAPDRTPPPELLVFEDGKEVAMIDEDGILQPLKKRPNGFVEQQWLRAVSRPSRIDRVPTSKHFSCETIPVQLRSDGKKNGRATTYCRGTTRTGLKIVWTDDFGRFGQACDEADVAIVARALRAQNCRSQAVLVTLKTLRLSGSIAVVRAPFVKALSTKPDQTVSHPPKAAVIVTASIADRQDPWNVHRHAPWPEHWSMPPSELPQPKEPLPNTADQRPSEEAAPSEP